MRRIGGRPALAGKAGDVSAKPVPEDYPRVTPYLCVAGAAAAIDFYVAVLGATERMRMEVPDGRIGHAELLFGESVVMLADEFVDMGFLAPKSVGGTPVTLQVYVEDVDAVFAAALAKGATQQRAVENQFYGDRSGQFVDPFGHRWNVATRVEDLSGEELEKRTREAMKAMPGGD
jgi:PhnB protein